MRSYLALIQKYPIAHSYGLAVYVKEGLFFAWGSSLETADSYLCFWLALLHGFTSLCQSPSLTLCTVFDTILSKIDEVFSITPSANVFVLEDFNVHHKDWLTHSGETDRPDELCYNGFPSIGKFWSGCCLSFHWRSNKLKTGCPVSLCGLWLLFYWLGWALWLFERSSIGGYLWTQCLCCC